MSVVSPAELAYLRAGQRLGRLTTIDPTGQPHVVPLGWRYNPVLDTIDLSGHDFARTRKFRNVQANPKVAFVVDDVLPPFRPRGILIQGSAQALDAETADGSEALIRITGSEGSSPGEIWTMSRTSRPSEDARRESRSAHQPRQCPNCRSDPRVGPAGPAGPKGTGLDRGRAEPGSSRAGR